MTSSSPPHEAGADSLAFVERQVVDNDISGGDEVWQQALDWIMRMREGVLQAHEEQQLLEWLDRSHRHVLAFRRGLAVWEATGSLTPGLRAALEVHGHPPSDDRSAASR